MHSEMWWPRLLRHHGPGGGVAWDDYEKDYSDLPEEVLQRHRWVQGGGLSLLPLAACFLSGGAHLSLPGPLSSFRVAEAIKDDERRVETAETGRREALQVRRGGERVGEGGGEAQREAGIAGILKLAQLIQN